MDELELPDEFMATELVPEMPREWIEGTGKVRWSKPLDVRRLRCEDCMHLIEQWYARYPELTRAPGLAHRSMFKRRQGKTVTAHCQYHYDLRVGNRSNHE